MDKRKVRNIVEAALLAARDPIGVDDLLQLFEEAEDRPERKEIRDALKRLEDDYADRGIEIREVAGGYRIQVKPELKDWISRLWKERPPRYSRALMETLALIAYRQPITRGEIESVRGVSVSTNIIRSMLEREWIRIVGHREVPGRPAMFGTTREFLSYFDLKTLDDLPSLAELSDIESPNIELDLGIPVAAETSAEGSGSESGARDREGEEEEESEAEHFAELREYGLTGDAS